MSNFSFTYNLLFWIYCSIYFQRVFLGRCCGADKKSSWGFTIFEEYFVKIEHLYFIHIFVKVSGIYYFGTELSSLKTSLFVLLYGRHTMLNISVQCNVSKQTLKINIVKSLKRWFKTIIAIFKISSVLNNC